MSKFSKFLPLLPTVVVAIIGISVAGYFYYQYTKTTQELHTLRTDPTTIQKAAQEEAKRLIEKVGQLIDLPTGEEPTVATISDIEKLKDQAFFAKAQNGDKLLIYTNAKKAILYDADTHKILDVAPVNIGSSSAEPAKQARIMLKNGTTTTGLTAKVEAEIKKAFPEINIVGKENATKNDYKTSVIVVLNDEAKVAAEALAKSMNIPIGNLPDGESKPQNVDILIIVGGDKI